jgi:cation diffusion facilitator CzcD-associated flavoprotein CzcO
MAAPHHRVAIVGTGFSGLGMAIRLAQRGQSDYVVLEKADEVGGTWRDNRYPGCACDIPSRLYSFSFEQNPLWSRDFATAPEIWAYLRDVTDRYAVRDRIAFGADLRVAEYDEVTSRWTLTAADGRQWTADSLVLGVGGLHEPKYPDIPGLPDFAGPVLHTADWPAEDGLDDKRVAVVGTGASAVQLIPAVAPRAAHTMVFQRTPTWIIAKGDGPWSGRRQRAFRRLPALQRAVRWRTYLRMEANVPAFTRYPWLAKPTERAALRQLAKAVPDPVTRAKLTPQYHLGCKRVLLSDDYWPSFARDDVSLVTDAITRIEPEAVVTADGSRHEVDALVVATGFDITGSFTRMTIRGQQGRTLEEAWSSGAHAPRHHRGRLPRALHPARAQHRPGPHLRRADDRVCDELRPPGARARPFRSPGHDPCGTGVLRPGGGAAQPAHGVGQRLQELVPRPVRQQRLPLAGLHGRVLVADPSRRRPDLGAGHEPGAEGVR